MSDDDQQDDDPNVPHVPRGSLTVVGGREPMDLDDKETAIGYLAGLTAVQYEQARKVYSARLDMRLEVLDKQVKIAQEQQTGSAGRTVVAERRPWADAVDGDELVSSLIADLMSYVSLEPDYAAVTSFWTLHTYLVNQSYITPRLAITAPQPRCGKTTLVLWLKTVVQRPFPSVNVSAAAIYHIVEAFQPTWLIDEADTFLAASNELRGILNSGFEKNGVVHRWNPQGKCFESFSTFSAAAISLIGALPGTLQDRSLRIRLRRRTPDEEIKSLRTDQADDELARKCARWALDNEHAYANTDPVIPAQLFNRVADNWRPMLALADVVGGEWPAKLREVAVRIAQLEEGEDPSADTQLLRDICEIFGDSDWITTGALVSALHAREYLPMSGKRLAMRLKPYGIEPRQERRGTKVERGYLASDFTDAFARYLAVPDVPLVPASTRLVGSVAGGRVRPVTNGTNGTDI